LRINTYSKTHSPNDTAAIPRLRLFGIRRTTVLLFLTLLYLGAVVVVGSLGVQAQETGAPGLGSARAENLEMSVRAGFGRLSISSWTGSWVPFRISISNQGPPILGRLVVHCEADASRTTQMREYVKQIQLPTGSQQLHEIAAFLNSGEAPIVRLEADDAVIAETRISVERSYSISDQLEIAVIDTDTTTLNNISQAEIVRLPNRAPFKAFSRQTSPSSEPDPQAMIQPPPTPQTRRGRFGGPGFGRPTFLAHPTVMSAEDLPRDFICYDQLDAVVIGDAPLNQLNEEQSQALRLWVASGGLLIVTGAADTAGLRAIGLETIAPVDPLATSTSQSLASMTEVYGSFDSNDRSPLLGSRLRPGAYVLLGSADSPIVAERSYGSGRVRFVAINPKVNPYRSWSAARELWSDLLLPAAETKPKHMNWITVGRRGTSTSNRWGAQGFLFKLAQIAPPSPKYVLLFLLAYVLALGPVNYLVLRWRKKTDLAWLTIPAVVITFAIVSVAIAQIGRGSDSIVADVSLVELHQRDGVSRASTGLLMMPSTKRTQEVVFDGRATFANDVYNGNQSSSASAIGLIECERSPKDFTMRVPMTTWTFGLFEVRSISEGVQPEFSASVADGAVSVRNLGANQISKAVLLSSDGISSMFDLAAGATQRIRVSTPEQMSFNGWYLSQFEQGSTEAELFLELSGSLDHEIGGDRAITQGFFNLQMMPDAIKNLERPILIGFVEKGATGIGFSGALKRKSKSLYVVHL